MIPRATRNLLVNLSYLFEIVGDPSRIRTCNPRSRNPLLKCELGVPSLALQPTTDLEITSGRERSLFWPALVLAEWLNGSNHRLTTETPRTNGDSGEQSCSKIT